MFSKQMINGFKNYFKSETLSDRRIKIIEIEEKLPFCGEKRKSSWPTETECSKKQRPYSENSEIIGENKDDSSSSDSSKTISINKESNNNENLNSTEVSSKEVFHTSNSDEDNDSSSPFSKDFVYSEFPVHSIVLCVNSEYFQKMLVDCHMKESKLNTISIKVPRKKGKYLEMLIQAFYNEDILQNLQLSDLLQLLEMANRFSCTSFVEQTLKSLNSKQISSVDDCDCILTHLDNIATVESAEKAYDDLKTCCTKFLSEFFFPLEFNYDGQNRFITLSFPSVFHLICSKHSVTLSENHLFIFVYKWLLSNKSYQTSSVIESLLSEIHSQSMTPSFLHDEISICDKVLNIWEGYPNWFSNVLKYHLLTNNNRNLRFMKKSSSKRNLPRNFLEKKMFIEKKFQLQDGELIDITKDKVIVWSGCLITPILNLKKVTCHSPQKNIHTEFHAIEMDIFTDTAFSPASPIECFCRQIDFCFTLLSGDINFEMGFLDHEIYRRKYSRSAQILLQNKQCQNFEKIAVMNDKFLDTFKEKGLNMIIIFKKSFDANFVSCDWSEIRPAEGLLKLFQK